MKITELKCTACGGDLKVDKNNPGLAVCEYCKRQYGIEWENEGAVHFRKETPEHFYIPREPDPRDQGKKTGWEPYGWKRGLALGFLAMAVLVGMNFKGIMARYRQDKNAVQGIEVNLAGEAADAISKIEGLAPLPESIMSTFVETVFDKPLEQISAEELSRIHRLEIGYKEGWQIGYSMKNEEALTWVSVGNNTSSLGSLSFFTGLTDLKVNGDITPEMVKGLHLKSLSCREDSISSIAAALEFPGELEALEVSGVAALDGISELTGLTALTLHADEITDIAPLAQAKSLKKLELMRFNETSDFSVLTTLTSLEELSIDADNLKGLGFLRQLPQLTSLSVEDATLMNLDGIQDLKNLKSLSIISCDDTQSMRELSQLSGLEHLWLEIPYGCEEPDLTGLTALKTLHADHFSQLDFLKSMTQLESLSLESCTVNNPAVFSHLTALKELKCARLSGQLDSWSFAGKLTGLEVLDLTGVATYEDISSLFRIPSLKKLLLNGVECEIRFQNLTPNPSLQVLEISGVKLYKNVVIQGGGGIYQIDYDPVNLADHMDFLVNFPNLTDLNLSGNKLTDLSALQTLEKLQSLNIEENFITDLKPLTGLSALNTLRAGSNPIENYQILSDKVTVFK